MRRLSLLTAALLCSTSLASADPIITPLAFSLFAGPLGALLSFQAIYTGLQIALAVGVSLIGGALSRQQTIDPGEYKQTFENAEQSEIRSVGRVRIGGLKAFGNTSGFSGFRLILHNRGPVSFVEEHYLGGRLVVVGSDGKVETPPWAVSTTVKPDGAWVKIYSKPGDGSETAWGPLLSFFPDLWTAAHRVRGIAQTLIQYDSPGVNTPEFGKLYQGGYPDYERIQRSDPVYDPRDGGQSVDNPATWQWSDNGVLCAVHVMRSYPEFTSADFDWTDIAAEATKADAMVATKTGTEPRSRCWGVWRSEDNRGDVMRQVLDSIGGEVSLSDDGLIRIRLIDDTRAPADLTYTDERHILSYAIGSGPEAPERPNQCRVVYYSPERNYTMADLNMSNIAWANNQAEIDRYGEKPMEVRLPFCPSASQAQRIARQKFFMALAKRGTIRTNMSGIAAMDRETINVSIADLGSPMHCLVDDTVRVDDEPGECEIPIAVLPVFPPWDPATMEADAPEQLPDFEYTADIDKPSILNVWMVQYPNDLYEVRLVFDTLPAGTNTARGIYRTYTGALPDAWTSMAIGGVPGGTTPMAYANFVAPPGVSDYRVQVYNSDGEASHWSDIFNATPAITNAQPELITGSVSDDGIGQFSSIYTPSPQAAYVRLSEAVGGVVLDEKNIRPNEGISLSDPTPPVNPGTYTYRITVHTTDGTSSVPYDIPQTISA